MKALRRKDTKEWLTKILGNALFTGNMPKEVYDDVMTVKDIEKFYARFIEESINLSDYELVEIEITVKAVIDENK